MVKCYIVPAFHIVAELAALTGHVLVELTSMNIPMASFAGLIFKYKLGVCTIAVGQRRGVTSDTRNRQVTALKREFALRVLLNPIAGGQETVYGVARLAGAAVSA